MKPGYKTTEFWVTLIAKVVSLLVILGVFTPEQASVTMKVVILLGGITGMVASAFGYSLSRGAAKKGQARQEDLFRG